eukprot:GFUD01006925.1.p1 GENE.GFUD01006925.1~~GFUD01006925.1.p1  ORF type:complete len:498 (-),score=113.70 GFUD01006925.1:444-1937(-)
MQIIRHIPVLLSLFTLCLTDLTPRDSMSDLQRSLNTPEAHRVHRASDSGNVASRVLLANRQKQMRKIDIRNHIEDSFNWKDKSMPRGDQVKDKVSQLPGLIFPISTTVAPSPMSIDYTERVQSFFPECNYKHKTRLILQAPEDPNIDIHFFKIKFPSARAGSQLSINAAKLRIYKIGAARPTPRPNCPPENKIRITVSWLKLRNSGIRPAEQVMLDSVMVDGSIAGWTTLDVTGAVRSWYQHQHMPMALMIEVEDISKRDLNAKQFLQTIKCKIAGTNPTISSGGDSFRTAPSPHLGGGPTIPSLNMDMQPLIDISTLEIPNGQDIPDNIMVWGLPQGSLLDTDNTVPFIASLQNVEIHHRPALSKKILTPDPQNKKDNNNLLTLEEVDYLASPSSDSQNIPNPFPDPSRYSPYSSSGRSGIQPIATRVILSRDDLTKKLAELSTKQDRIRTREDNFAERIEILANQQKDDSQFLKDLLMSLMTSTENKEVFGRNRN